MTKANELFQKYFGVSLKQFMINQLSVLFATIVIDIVAFDEYLRKTYSTEYTDGISMNKFILSKFGQEAADFFNKLNEV